MLTDEKTNLGNPRQKQSYLKIVMLRCIKCIKGTSDNDDVHVEVYKYKNAYYIKNIVIKHTSLNRHNSKVDNKNNCVNNEKMGITVKI